MWKLLNHEEVVSEFDILKTLCNCDVQSVNFDVNQFADLLTS